MCDSNGFIKCVNGACIIIASIVTIVLELDVAIGWFDGFFTQLCMNVDLPLLFLLVQWHKLTSLWGFLSLNVFLCRSCWVNVVT